MKLFLCKVIGFRQLAGIPLSGPDVKIAGYVTAEQHDRNYSEDQERSDTDDCAHGGNELEVAATRANVTTDKHLNDCYNNNNDRSPRAC